MEKTAIFVDAGHLHYHLFESDWRIDYRKLIDYFISRGYVPMTLFYYEGTPTWLSYSSKVTSATYNDFNLKKKAKKEYFAKLRNLGYVVRTKPVHRLFDHKSGDYIFKCNFDVELTIDAVDTIYTKELSSFIICSGDGDHTRLVKYLKEKGKRVLVVGFKVNLNYKMIESANETVFLEAIKEKIKLEHK